MHALLICVRNVPGCVPGCVPGSGSWLLGGGAKVARHAELLELAGYQRDSTCPNLAGEPRVRFLMPGFVGSKTNDTCSEDPTQQSQREEKEPCAAYLRCG